jgi:hypothetical protein
MKAAAADGASLLPSRPGLAQVCRVVGAQKSSAEAELKFVHVYVPQKGNHHGVAQRRAKINPSDAD